MKFLPAVPHLFTKKDIFKCKNPKKDIFVILVTGENTLQKWSVVLQKLPKGG